MELDEMEKRIVSQENRFVRTHRISASLSVFAEASFVGEETAQRCKWRIHESKKKTVMTRAHGNVAVTGVLTAPIWIGKRMLTFKLFVLPYVGDTLVLGQDIVPKFKVGQGHLLLTLEDGKVVDTLKKDKSFGMSFEATYVDEEDEQEGGGFEGDLREVKEHEQAATASRTRVFKSASNRKNAKQRLRSCEEAEQQLVSESEPSASQVKEFEHSERTKEPEHSAGAQRTEQRCALTTRESRS